MLYNPTPYFNPTMWDRAAFESPSITTGAVDRTDRNGKSAFREADGRGVAAARGISKCDVDLREAFYSSAASDAVLIKINRDHGTRPAAAVGREGGLPILAGGRDLVLKWSRNDPRDDSISE